MYDDNAKEIEELKKICGYAHKRLSQTIIPMGSSKTGTEINDVLLAIEQALEG